MELEERDLIEKYLYGELSDSEQESVEERFFLDAEFYEKIETVEMDLIDQYVLEGMKPEEKLHFERSYLNLPERQKKVIDAALFHKELAQFKPVVHPEPVLSATQSWSDWFSSLFDFQLHGLKMVTAAAVVLVVAGVFWVIQSDNSTEIAGGRNPIETPPINSGIPRKTISNNGIEQSVKAKLIPKVHHGIRTSDDTLNVETVIVKTDETTKTLILELPLPAQIRGEGFLINIDNQARKEVLTRKYSRQPEETSGGRYITLSVPLREFTNGEYTVFINSENQSEISAIYRFNITGNNLDK